MIHLLFPVNLNFLNYFHILETHQEVRANTLHFMFATIFHFIGIFLKFPQIHQVMLTVPDFYQECMLMLIHI